MVWDAYEVDTDCGDVGLGVGVVGEPQEQARLSNTGVTDEEQLEKVVVSVKCQLVVRSDRMGRCSGRLSRCRAGWGEGLWKVGQHFICRAPSDRRRGLDILLRIHGDGGVARWWR